MVLFLLTQKSSDGLNENVPKRLRYLNTYLFPVGDALRIGLGSAPYKKYVNDGGL